MNRREVLKTVGVVAIGCLSLKVADEVMPLPDTALFYTVEAGTNRLMRVDLGDLKPGQVVIRVSDDRIDTGTVLEGARPVTHPDGNRGIEVDHRTFQSFPRAPSAP